jgi:hypothetical protein
LCVPDCHIDKYDEVEFLVESSVEEWLAPQTGGENKGFVQADLTGEINLVFTEIYACGR